MSLYGNTDKGQSSKIATLEKRIKTLQKYVPMNYILGNEQDTGKKWIDGSKIYIQTFSMLTPGTGDISLPHGITGLDIIVSGATGYCELVDGTKIPLPVLNHASSGGSGSGGGSSDAANTITIVEWDSTNLLGYVGTNYGTTKAVASLVFTIEYTKV